MCKKHYARFKKYGSDTVNLLPQRGKFGEELLRACGWEVTSTGCWEFLGNRDSRGYGRITGHGKAHRISYETWIGPLPDGVLVRHKCDNPPCINPDHLESGTPKDNVLDCVSRGRYRNGRQVIPYSEWSLIYQKYRDGTPSSELAAHYGVAPGQITRIVGKLRSL